MIYLFPHRVSGVFLEVFRKLPSYRFWISAKTITRNSEFPSENFSFEYKIYVPYIFHNFQKNSELSFLCMVQTTITQNSEFLMML